MAVCCLFQDPQVGNVNLLELYYCIAQKLMCHISLGPVAASLQNIFSSSLYLQLTLQNPEWISL